MGTFEKSRTTHINVAEMLGPFTTALLVKADNGLYAVHPDDHGVGGELRNNGSFGSEQIETLSKIIKKTDKLLIVGAHVGTVAIPLSRLCFHLTAIEANPNTFELLHLNVLLNQIHNCEIFKIAASEKYEEIKFLLSTANSGGSKRKPVIGHHWYTYDNPTEVSIPAAPLDDFLESNDFDVVIMDIEGSEYFALKGMKAILENARTLVIEFLPHHLKNVSGVSVEDFLSVLPSYDYMSIPSNEIKVDKDQIYAVLEYMYENNIEDEGIIFEKKSSENKDY